MKKQIDTNDTNFNIMVYSAIRYALSSSAINSEKGRKSDVAKAIVNFVTPLLHDLSMTTLCIIQKDIVDACKYNYLDNKTADKSMWIKLYNDIQAITNI